MKKDIFDKFQFVFHRVIGSVILWITTVLLHSYQQFVIKHIKNILLNFTLYMGAFILSMWFFNISLRKSTWKPFGRRSDMIGGLIICSIYLLLICILGFPKVTFQY